MLCKPRSALCVLVAIIAFVFTSLSGNYVAASEKSAQTRTTSNTVQDTPLRISIEEAVKLALAWNPVTKQADAKTAGAEARLRAAGALPNPTIAVAHGFGSNTGGLDEDILLTQTFEMGGKRSARVNQARAERDASLSEKLESTIDITLAVKMAYYEVLRSDQDYQLAKDSLDTARRFAEAARTQYTAGDVAHSNVLRSETEVAQSTQNLIAAETERSNAYAALGSLIGVPDDKSLLLTDNLHFSPVTYNLASLQLMAISDRPDIRVEKLLRDSAKAAVQVARTEGRPDLFVEGRHADINPSIGGNSVRIGITIPLIDLGQMRADVSAAKSGLAEEQAKLGEATRAARLDVETAFNDMQQSQKVVESFQTGRLDRAKELLTVAETGYAKGATSYLELLDAQQVYRNEEADYTRTLAAYNIAIAELEHAVGGSLK